MKERRENCVVVHLNGKKIKNHQACLTAFFANKIKVNQKSSIDLRYLPDSQLSVNRNACVESSKIYLKVGHRPSIQA